MLNNIWANLTMSIVICLCCNICWVTLDRASSFASWKAARIFLEYKSQTILFWFASFANDSTPCNETLACKNRAGYFALCLEIYIVWAMNQSVNPSIHNPYPYISFLYWESSRVSTSRIHIFFSLCVCLCVCVSTFVTSFFSFSPPKHFFSFPL